MQSFPKEILRPPRSLAARTYTDIRRWTAMPRGGHFAALEQPELLAARSTEFFGTLR
jgi:microsomal epoxide hydrolase